MPPENNEPTFEEILQFDPFDQSSDAGAGEGDGQNQQESAQTGQSGEETGEGGEQQQQQPVQPSGQQQPGQQTLPSPTPPTQMSQADLERLIARQTEALTGVLRTQPAQQRQDQPAPNKFNLGVPDALANALRSEDPAEFRSGVGAMINGVANHVWNSVMEHLEKTVAPQISRGVESYVQSVRQQEQVATDFYGTYPQLQLPELAPVVQAVGAMIAQEYAQAGKPLGWSPQLRDAIANRIFERMPFLRQAPQQQQRQQGNGQQRRSFATGNGARPNNGGTQDETQRDMEAMIFGPR